MHPLGFGNFLADASSSGDTVQNILNLVMTRGVDIALMILAALVAWFIGSWAIRLITRVAVSRMESRKIDPTLVRYVSTSLGVVLKVFLLIIILGIFGVETTSFAAIFAAAGVAIGMAWAGLLSNFAAGFFMIILRPIKVGDYVTVAGITGVVREIGLFVTKIDTDFNVCTIIGNAKVFDDTLSNYSANPHRIASVPVQLSHKDDYKEAIKLLSARAATITHVLQDPAPAVVLSGFTERGPVVSMNFGVRAEDYLPALFATNAAIQDTLSEAGFNVPSTHIVLDKDAA